MAHPAISASRRLATALARMAVLVEAPASRALDDSVNVAGSKPEGSPPPGVGAGDQSMLEEWIGRVERICEVAEREIAEVQNGRMVAARSRDGVKARILNAHVGLPPNRVAFIEDCDPSHVRKVRAANGQKAADGSPADRKETLASA